MLENERGILVIVYDDIDLLACSIGAVDDESPVDAIAFRQIVFQQLNPDTLGGIALSDRDGQARNGCAQAAAKSPREGRPGAFRATRRSYDDIPPIGRREHRRGRLLDRLLLGNGEIVRNYVVGVGGSTNFAEEMLSRR